MRYFRPQPSPWSRLFRLLGILVGIVAVLAAIGVAANRWYFREEEEFIAPEQEGPETADEEPQSVASEVS